ncbi:DUF3817 domain-containing protein [Ornithinimicrobium cryptoxanthini]|uniref:DUF3817 domain-containing protein n=1 Tax=Ornithinimicrobium cryptoxanthini TaxID=2934161 RepID=A0ABY4YK54_9MICO|nr:DUF3817 domain-containing protein [Ornithinimicrobium cryptoxanthini]USQ77173.1 DUF3817 domain-containing protein [Ornithinimicrobium cryptoxanthini]
MSDRAKLRFFQVMATVVGLGLLLLVLEMVLWYGFDNDVLRWWAMPHGFLYMIYLGAVAMLGFALGWSLGRMVLIMLAGVVPFLSFWVESRVTRSARAQIEAKESATAPDPANLSR